MSLTYKILKEESKKKQQKLTFLSFHVIECVHVTRTHGVPATQNWGQSSQVCNIIQPEHTWKETSDSKQCIIASATELVFSPTSSKLPGDVTESTWSTQALQLQPITFSPTEPAIFPSHCITNFFLPSSNDQHFKFRLALSPFLSEKPAFFSELW